MKPTFIIFNFLNLPKHICTHLLGKDHSHIHRMSVGVVVMSAGVGISKLFADIYVLHFICDMCGYGIHAMGTMPFLEAISNSLNQDDV